jgi:hypothetical protein
VRVVEEPSLAWWRPLAQAVLAAPHLLWTGALSAASFGFAFVTAACVLVSGRAPRSLAALHALTLRERVRCYSYWFALRTGHPPLASRPQLADPGDDPKVTVDVVAAVGFRRVDALARLIVLPVHLVVLVPIGAVMDACYPLWIALAAVNGGWPPAFRRFLVAVEQWVVALAAYALFLTNERPAFGLRAHGYEAGTDASMASA